MKKKLQLWIAIFTMAISSVIYGQTNVGKSIAADFNVSASGALTYSVPFELPNYVLGHFPQLGLAFNSQAGDGVAGYGWSITGLSSITRIPATEYHDGFIDPVDFDNNDRYALDGQRLMLKSGIYGSSGSVYETEAHSNLKIVANGNGNLGGPESFIVYHPNGLRYHYGGDFDETYSGLEWVLEKIEDTQGNVVNLEYNKRAGIIRLETVEDRVAKVKIKFNYGTKTNVNPLGVGGGFYSNNNLLTSVDVKVNNTQPYYSYHITHENMSNGTKKIKNIKQRNGNGQELPPITFNYVSNTSNDISVKTQTELSTLSSKHMALISGDFNGDGRMDFIQYPHDRNNLSFEGGIRYSKAQTNGGFWETTISRDKLGGKFEKIFTGNYVKEDGEASSEQGIVLLRKSNNKLIFDSYRITTSFRGRVEKLHSVVWSSPPLDTRIPSDALKVTHTSGNAWHNLDKTADNIVATNILNRNRKATYTAKEGIWLKPGFHAKAGSTFKAIVNGTVQDKVLPLSYLTGDFNGDGVVDILAIIKKANSYGTFAKAYLINLNPKNGKGVTYLGGIQNDIYDDHRLLVGDYNGDGKADLFHQYNNEVKVYSISNSGFKYQTKTTSGNFHENNKVSLGDFNGDGKTDIINSISDTNTTWEFHISNGRSFYKFSQDIGAAYWKDREGWFSDYECNKNSCGSHSYAKIRYLFLDYDGDGKTDLVRHRIYQSKHDAKRSWQMVNFFTNTSKSTSLTPKISFFKKETIVRNNDGEDILNGHSIFANFKNRNLMNQYAYMDKSGKIVKYEVDANFREEACISSVTNNGLTTSFEYEGIIDNSSSNSVYSKYTIKDYTYPYVNIENIRGFKVVKRIDQQFNTFSRYRKFKYYGLISSLDGSGITGFERMASCGWANNTSVSEIWNFYTHDMERKGITTKFSTYQGENFNSNSLIAETDYEYNYHIKSNKSYVAVPTRTIYNDNLKGTQLTTTNTYDSYYNLTSVVESYTGGSKTNDFAYYNNSSGTGSNYYIGRPKSKTETSVLQGGVFSTSEEYTYQNNYIHQLKRRGNNTDWITEIFAHDNFGNITSKAISGSGITSRTETSVYDVNDTGRFLMSKTGIEGLTATYEYDKTLGQLKKQIDAFGKEEEFKYDAWNRLSEQKDYLGNTVTTAYTGLTGGGVKIVANNSLGGGSEVYTNRMGWEYLTKEKNVLGQWVNRRVEYDAVGKKLDESQPHFQSTDKWTHYRYDVYNRLYRTDLYTGQRITTSFNGLTVIVNDGTKTISTTSDVLGNKISITDPGGTITYKYYANNALKESNYNGHKIITKIDGWGRKTELNDPAAGVYTYKYNILGELLEENTPVGKTTYTLDGIGKPLTKKIEGQKTNMHLTYSYYPTNKLVQSIIGVDNINAKTYTYNYVYDTNNRPSSITETLPEASFSKTIAYDTQGRVSQEIYTGNAVGVNESQTTNIGYEYHSISGQLYRLKDNVSSNVLWEIKEVNDWGQVTKSTTPYVPLEAKNIYDSNGLPREFSLQEGTNTPLAKLNMQFDAIRGNLTNRTNQNFSKGLEEFEYDSLDRLTKTKGAIVNDITYDSNGNINTSDDTGTYNYQQSTKYRLQDVTLNAESSQYYQNHALQQVSYNAYKKPVSISEQGHGKVDFEYGPLMNRSIAYYGGENTDKLQRDHTKIYSAIIPAEIVIDNTNNNAKFITYIGGDEYSASLAHVTQTSPEVMDDFLYLFRDHLGSIMTIMKSDGGVIERAHYGAWGTIEEYSDVYGNQTLGYESILGRGYTGHEHFVSVGLLHMNGRMYDPKLKRFLSPDNYIVDPFNTQHYNRYGYVWNNPLRYNDPSGEIPIIAAALIGGAIGVITNGIANTQAGQGFFEGAFQAFVMGTVQGGFAAGIGHAFQPLYAASNTVGNTILVGAAQATVHGGLGYAASGGHASGFWSGFAGSVIGSFGNAAFGSTGNKLLYATGTIIMAGISGGLISEFTGGDFIDGFRNGVIAAGLNHVLHSVAHNVSQRTWRNKWFSSKKEAYDYAMTFDKEVSGWILENGEYVVLDPFKNSEGSSYNGQIRPYRFKGVQGTYISRNGDSVRIIGHFHTHPDIVSTRHNPIGVSTNDIQLMMKLGLPTTILHLGQEWQLSSGNMYTDRGFSYSLKNLGFW